VVRRVGELAAVDPVAVEEPADRRLQAGRQQVDMSVDYVAVYVLGHQSGLPGAPRWLTPRGEAGNTHGKRQDGKSFSTDETRGESVARIVLTNGLVFDGTGTPPVPGEVTLADDRVLAVTPGYRADHGSDQVIDATGCTVMPGLNVTHIVDRDVEPPERGGRRVGHGPDPVPAGDVRLDQRPWLPACSIRLSVCSAPSRERL
jgi:hypothetical protein